MSQQHDQGYDIYRSKKVSKVATFGNLLFCLGIFFVLRFFQFTAEGMDVVFDSILDNGTSVYHTCEQYISR